MYIAGESGHFHIVELLLSRGAEVDSRDKVSTCINVKYYQCNQYVRDFTCTYTVTTCVFVFAMPTSIITIVMMIIIIF